MQYKSINKQCNKCRRFIYLLTEQKGKIEKQGQSEIISIMYNYRMKKKIRKEVYIKRWQGYCINNKGEFVTMGEYKTSKIKGFNKGISE